MSGTRGTGKNKAGKSERLEPYEVLTNSPIQKEIVARLRRGGAEHPEAHDEPGKPEIIGMMTPTRVQAAPDTPPMTIGAPGENCTTEELRIWVTEAIRGIGKDATALEVRASSRINDL